MTFKKENAENNAYQKLSDEGKTIVDRMDKTYYMRERLMVAKLKDRENDLQVQLKEMSRDLTEIENQTKDELRLSALKSDCAGHLLSRFDTIEIYIHEAIYRGYCDLPEDAAEVDIDVLVQQEKTVRQSIQIMRDGLRMIAGSVKNGK